MIVKSKRTTKKLEGSSIKRILTGTLTAVMVLSVCATSALAAGPGRGRGWNYVDADGDGVCDNLGTGCGFRGGRGW